MTTVGIKLLEGDQYKPLKAHSEDACYDVFATSILYEDDNKVHYGLGFALELPPNFRADLRARSSIHKTGLILSNGVGTGDAGYSGEYQAVFYKIAPNAISYFIGDRVAQIKFEKVEQVEFQEVKDLSKSVRGVNGFGSSGGYVHNNSSGKVIF